MREKIEPVMHIIDTAFAAMEAVGVKPNVKPIRGGTDGAQPVSYTHLFQMVKFLRYKVKQI